MTLTLIGAAFCVGGTLLLASMWFSSRGADAASHRDPLRTPRTPRTLDRRYEEEPLQRI